MVAKATIKGFLGIDRAELDIVDGITLLAGINAVGKSSLLEGISCVARAHNQPLDIPKGESEELLHDGAKEGFIKLEVRGGVRKLSLPECEIATLSGRCFTIGESAAGVKKYSDLEHGTRAKILARKLNAQVTRQRLEDELADNEVTEEVKTKVLDLVFGNEQNKGKGMSAAETYAKTEARDLKRQFKELTTKNWGEKQGRSFKPPGYFAYLDEHKNDSILQEKIVKARENLEAAIAENALSEDEIIRLKALVETEHEEKEKITQYDDLVRALEPELGQKQGELESAKAFRTLLTCQECGAPHRLVDGGLQLAEKVEEPKSSFNDINKEVMDLKTRLDNAAMGRKTHTSNVDRIMEAKAKLKKIEKKQVDGSVVDAARKELAEAESLLKAWQIKQQGLKLHAEIKSYLKVADICSSTGLEMQVLLAALEDFNKDLGNLSDKARWSRVSIDNDLIARFGGRHYRLLSKSEKYRVDATIQMQFALIDESPMVIYDEADVLDKDGRNEFFRLLKACGIPALVGMTVFPKKDGTLEVPDLSKAKIGVTYWVKDNSVTRLGQEVANAVAG